jgi:hypothetical protein
MKGPKKAASRSKKQPPNPIGKYEYLYRKEGLSRWPRAELVSAALVLGLSAGLAYTLFMRAPSDINFGAAALAIWFLLLICFNLFHPAAVSIFVVMEGFYRLSRWAGKPIDPLLKGPWLNWWAYQCTFVIAIGLLWLPGYLLIEAFNYFWPHPILRRAPYTGGG